MADKDTTPSYELDSNYTLYDLRDSNYQYGYASLNISNTNSSSVNYRFNLQFPIPDNFSYGTKFDWTSEDLGMVGKAATDAIKKLGFSNADDFEKGNYDGFLSRLGSAVWNNGGDFIRAKAYEGVRNFFRNTSALGNGDAVTKEFMKGYGIAHNPNKQLYFNGVDLEEFNVKFSLAPSSQKQATEMKNALLNLNNSVHPDISDSGLFFKYPPLFDFDICVAGGVKLFREEALAITSLNIGFSDDGSLTWHDDGIPTSVSVEINFKETSIRAKKNGQTKLPNITLFGE